MGLRLWEMLWMPPCLRAGKQEGDLVLAGYGVDPQSEPASKCLKGCDKPRFSLTPQRIRHES